MEKLDERCLYYINKHLKPHDWIQVSRVSRLWHEATLKNWETITVIKYFNFHYKDHETQAITISAADAEEIVSRAAPFVQRLDTEPSADRKFHYLTVGPYYYRAKDFKHEQLLKLMIAKATNITELEFENLSKASLVKQLFHKNKIRKFWIYNGEHGWYRKIPTHGIEELGVKLIDPNDNFVSFEGRFPNLQKLLLQISSHSDLVKGIIMSKILPFLPGLKWLDLSITGNNNPEIIFSDIQNLSELETLEIRMISFGAFPAGLLKSIKKSCPKLRSLSILALVNDEDYLRTLFSIPQLETIECSLETGLPVFDYQKPHRLTTLHFLICSGNPIFTGFFKVARQMSSLKSLQIDFAMMIAKRGLLLLVCGVVVAATSAGKDVVVSRSNFKMGAKKSIRKLRITRSSTQEAAETFEEDCKVLRLMLNFENEETLFQSVTEFVQKKVEGYHAFVIKKKK